MSKLCSKEFKDFYSRNESALCNFVNDPENRVEQVVQIVPTSIGGTFNGFILFYNKKDKEDE